MITEICGAILLGLVCARWQFGFMESITDWNPHFRFLIDASIWILIWICIVMTTINIAELLNR